MRRRDLDVAVAHQPDEERAAVDRVLGVVDVADDLPRTAFSAGVKSACSKSSTLAGSASPVTRLAKA
jgi:hypothetical protein